MFFMSTTAVKFNLQDKPEFVKELRKRVNQYFKDNNISKHADVNMVIKTVVMVSLYFVPMILLLTNTVSGILPVLLMWVIMGFGMSGIGTSIMHDANHGAYSQNPRVNQLLGFIVNFVGGYHVTWKIQHNVLHHSFTNVHGHDDDIDTFAIRLSPDQDRKKFHRFQAFYAVFFYSLMTLYWMTAKDFINLISYNKEGLVEGQGLTLRKALIQVAFHKVWYYALTLVLPLMLINVPWYITVLGFVIMHVICGLFLALVFQTAHVVENTSFFAPDEDGSLENSWAIHQVLTTANFGRKSLFFSWFIGGLNYQIEHHLFPNICHVHYKKLSPIVEQTAKEFNLPYHQYETFVEALSSHFKMLYQLGTGSIDQKLALSEAQA